MVVYVHQPMNGEPMKKLITLTVLASAALPTFAADTFKEPLERLGPKQQEFRNQATAGDYQGMRNLAFSYAEPFKGEAGSKIGACAWYLLIPAVHKQKFDNGDTGNISVYCGKLSPTELNTAYTYAFRVLAK